MQFLNNENYLEFIKACEGMPYFDEIETTVLENNKRYQEDNPKFISLLLSNLEEYYLTIYKEPLHGFPNDEEILKEFENYYAFEEVPTKYTSGQLVYLYIFLKKLLELNKNQKESLRLKKEKDKEINKLSRLTFTTSLSDQNIEALYYWLLNPQNDQVAAFMAPIELEHFKNIFTSKERWKVDKQITWIPLYKNNNSIQSLLALLYLICPEDYQKLPPKKLFLKIIKYFKPKSNDCFSVPSIKGTYYKIGDKKVDFSAIEDEVVKVLVKRLYNENNTTF